MFLVGASWALGRCVNRGLAAGGIMRPATFNAPYLPPERPSVPSIIETLAGRKRIGEMTADEYLKLVRETQIALEKPRPEWR